MAMLVLKPSIQEKGKDIMSEFKTLILPSGHPIVTPTGNPITQEEFHHYFQVTCDWLKEVRPESFESIKPSLNKKNYASMLNEMFIAYGYDPLEGGTMERYYLDERPLAFIFIVSYYIQTEDKEDISPLLSHILGNALLNWLPILELVEHHLSISARSGETSDGVTMAEAFGSGTRYRRWGFPFDKSKALEYATLAYESSSHQHDEKPFYVDYVYAKALFEFSKRNAARSMQIIREKLAWYQRTKESEYASNIAPFLALGLEISSNVRLPEALRIDLTFARKYLERTKSNWLSISECAYWLALCYIRGKNNPKNIPEAIHLLTTRIKNPSFSKLGAVALAQIYLDGNSIAKDPAKAYSIAYYSVVQCGIVKGHPDRGDAALKKILKSAGKVKKDRG